ncbi:hypothetical protein IOD16_33090 [Saccharothrix sp. 6-C]|uniref:hypothetical protein n=1 Tax=Saccharothrix sp. 6-C TaxID=2781735 RepID=UPI0019177342|nr:hypothetical protein [Saccharothrix sp. 6-C]QQQ75850.1 hypothetical protein IOD16_33090 [Saccharothrix sp. 6-C]
MITPSAAPGANPPAGSTARATVAVDPWSIVLTGGNLNDRTLGQTLAGRRGQAARPGPSAPTCAPRHRGIAASRHRFREAATSGPNAKVRVGGRPPAFDRTTYKRRNVVDKTTTSYQGLLDLATLLI